MGEDGSQIATHTSQRLEKNNKKALTRHSVEGIYPESQF